MTTCDIHRLFTLLGNIPQLTRIDLRQGCIGRTQIIGSILHHRGFRVGRVWALPVYESISFFAPLYDKHGQPLRVGATPGHHGNLVRWRYHCACCLPDLTGRPVIDFPLFTGAARLEAWGHTLQRAQRDCGAPPEVELRIVVHDFPDVPERQVLRHNRQALKQSHFIPERRLAQLASFALVPAPKENLAWKPHRGDGRIRRLSTD